MFQNDEMITSLTVNGGGGGGGGGAAGAGNGGAGGGGGGGGVVNGSPSVANRVARSLTLHRSNSSLELPHSPDPNSRVPDSPLRREYGSHGELIIIN